MDLSWTPRARFPRKKFISPSIGAPYRSPLMQSLPEKRMQLSFENISNELKTPTVAPTDKNDTVKEKIHQMQQKFLSPVAASSPYRSPLSHNLSLERKSQLPSKNISLDELKSSAMQLWEKNNVLKEKIHHLKQKGLKEKVKCTPECRIRRLHIYNKAKDFTLAVMEKIAIMEQKTIKEVHEDFGLTEND